VIELINGTVAMDAQQLSQKEFQQFQALILKLCGISVQDNKITLLSNRIRRRLRATNIPDFEGYLKLLKSAAGKDELEGFLNAVTTNETSFFRTEKHFEWLRTEFVEAMTRRAQSGEHPRSIRVWSAACSSGEEPYSIALCLAENQHKLTGWKIEILGTDISEHAIAKARAGIYDDGVSVEVPEKLRKRYFNQQPETRTWEIKPSLKQMVTIKRHNLMEPNPDSKFDCVFIRNVLIYFSRESKQVVIENLVRAMAKGGYLVVGPSEGIFEMLGMLTKRSTFLYQKE
jgi:chemotaxis protein methyltransferase CheR